ncbi:MAG: hypothetical protein DLM58_21525 [Pseudonocardiales bacterium]|nr:MAG: hypothetical protein DLM58_21525 [Pseudonocardiales bacterium]
MLALVAPEFSDRTNAGTSVTILVALATDWFEYGTLQIVAETGLPGTMALSWPSRPAVPTWHGSRSPDCVLEGSTVHRLAA